MWNNTTVSRVATQIGLFPVWPLPVSCWGKELTIEGNSKWLPAMAGHSGTDKEVPAGTELEKWGNRKARLKKQRKINFCAESTGLFLIFCTFYWGETLQD